MLRLRFVSLASAFVFFFGSSFTLLAQELSQFSSPVLTLDQERLFNGSLIAERVSAEMEKRSADLAAENRRIESELVAEELELTEKRAVMEQDAFRILADTFDEKVQAIREEQDAKALELQRQQDDIRQDFLRQITPVLADIVRERGAVVVLDRRSVFLSAEAIDITDQAIARINEVFGDGTDPAPDTPDTAQPSTDTDN